MAWVRLPNGVLLIQLVVAPDERVVGDGDDISNFFPSLRHHPDWVSRNAVGGELAGAHFADLGFKPDESYFLAFLTVAAGDLNAVDIAQETHIQILRGADCMRPHELLAYGLTTPPW